MRKEKEESKQNLRENSENEMNRHFLKLKKLSK